MTYYRDNEGNYIRTVTCGYCWTRGHNRSGCPDRAKKIEEQRAADPDCYSVKRYDQEKENKKTRTCSYCGDEGHNVRSCKSIAEHLENEIDRSIVYRALAYEHLKAEGIGVGALVHVDNYRGPDYTPIKVLGVISKIKWDDINHLSGRNYYGNSCITLKMQVPDCYGSVNSTVAFPYHPELCFSEHVQLPYEVVSPSNKLSPPDSWFNDISKENVKSFRDSLRGEGFNRAQYRIDQEREEQAQSE